MTAATKSTSQTTTKNTAESSEPNLLVVDIGKKQKRKRIKGLRKGRGRLFERVRGVVADLREEGAIDANSTPVVIVVREKSRQFGRW